MNEYLEKIIDNFNLINEKVKLQKQLSELDKQMNSLNINIHNYDFNGVRNHPGLYLPFNKLFSSENKISTMVLLSINDLHNAYGRNIIFIGNIDNDLITINQLSDESWKNNNNYTYLKLDPKKFKIVFEIK